MELPADRSSWAQAWLPIVVTSTADNRVQVQLNGHAVAVPAGEWIIRCPLDRAWLSDDTEVILQLRVRGTARGRRR